MTIRLDIGGPKGNAFYIMGTVRTLGKASGYSADEQKNILDEMQGKVIGALGGTPSYENLLAVYLHYFPDVELYADRDIGIDKELYTIELYRENIEL